MIISRREHLRFLCGIIVGAYLPVFAAQTDFNAFSDEDKERFLRSAKILSVEGISHGVTKPVRAEMVLGETKHLAHIQVVDKELPRFFPEDGSASIPMKDCWRYNIAAYRIDRLLDLRMVEVAASRPYQGKPAAFSWWADGVLAEEVDRIKNNLIPPNPDDFERRRALVRVFDELIINIDRNQSNLLIKKTWTIALIDHTRCFTPYSGIRNRENLTRCSRTLIAKMKSMQRIAVAQAVGNHLTNPEIAALMARRDRIVEHFEKAVREKGEENVLFS